MNKSFRITFCGINKSVRKIWDLKFQQNHIFYQVPWEKTIKRNDNGSTPSTKNYGNIMVKIISKKNEKLMMNV